MKRGWQVATLGLLLFAGLMLVIGLFGASFINARPLPTKDTLGPGPGFFPMWLSILALTLGAVLMVEVSRQPSPSADEAAPFPVPDRATIKKLGLLAALVLMVAWKFPEFPLLQKIGVSSEILRGFLASVIAAGCGVALAMLPSQHDEMSDNGALLRIASVLGLLTLTAGALDPLGFRFSALLFTGLLLYALGIKSPLTIAVFALTAGLGVFYVFYHALSVPLPIGPFDWVLKPVEIAANSLWSAIRSILSFLLR